MKLYVIDGARFSTLGEFYDEVERVLVPAASWGRNLDAFNDILRGGFGTPDEGFILRWVNSAQSRQRLGHAETCRILERQLVRCHQANRPRVSRELDAARAGEGPTVFDWLVEIIETHEPKGDEPEDGVVLELA